MRTWRKVYASMLESQQVASLSEGALNLFLFLIIAQDDSGYYPWNETKVRRLTAARPLWTRNEIDTWRNEIVTARLATVTEGGLVLDNGKKLNGVPRSDLKAELYPRNEIDTPRNEIVTLEQSRVEQSKSRAETPSVPLKGEAPPEKATKKKSFGVQKPKPSVSEAFVLRMIQDYAETWPEQRVREIIALSLGHKSARNYDDAELYVQGWLRRDAEKGGNNGQRPTSAVARANSGFYKTKTPAIDAIPKEYRGLGSKPSTML